MRLTRKRATLIHWSGSKLQYMYGSWRYQRAREKSSRATSIARARHTFTSSRSLTSKYRANLSVVSTHWLQAHSCQQTVANSWSHSVFPCAKSPLPRLPKPSGACRRCGATCKRTRAGRSLDGLAICCTLTSARSASRQVKQLSLTTITKTCPK